MPALALSDVLSALSLALLVAVLLLLRRMRASLRAPAAELRDVIRRVEDHQRTSVAPPAASSSAVVVAGLNRRLSAVEAIAEALARDLEAATPAPDGTRRLHVQRARQLARIAAGGRFREHQTTLALIWPQVQERLAGHLHPSHTLRAELPADVPAVVGAGETWVEILGELVGNALDASRGGGIVVVRAGAADAPGRVRVTVQDGGHGISPDALPHILEPFYTSREGHDGLGLPLVASLVEGLGGAITLASQPGAGTTVTVEVPAASPERAVNFSGQLLVADDDPDVRRNVGRLLESFGLTASVCDSGSVARSLLTADPARYRAAVLDVVMPGAPVEDVVRAVREKEPGFPILLMSGYDTMRMVDGVLALGGVRFLRKPFTREELFRALEDLLRAAP